MNLPVRARPPSPSRIEEKLRRRRFYLSRMKRTARDGRPVRELWEDGRLEELPESKLFAGLSMCIVGGQASRHYMPERTTVDIDVLIVPDQFEIAGARLQAAGYVPDPKTLAFPDSRLGLIGRRYRRDPMPIDMITSEQNWVRAATAEVTETAGRERAVPLPYLVLMKLDASRGVDQGDLTRMLGLAGDEDLRRVRDVIKRFLPSDRDDLEQYIEIGRLELGIQTSNDH